VSQICGAVDITDYQHLFVGPQGAGGGDEGYSGGGDYGDDDSGYGGFSGYGGVHYGDAAGGDDEEEEDDDDDEEGEEDEDEDDEEEDEDEEDYDDHKGNQSVGMAALNLEEFKIEGGGQDKKGKEKKPSK
jgi:hypothetical protein